MVWVKSEYAGELAVVSAWLAAVLPWTVSYTPDHVQFPGTVVVFRFPFGQVQYVFDFAFADAIQWGTPVDARTLVTGSVTTAYDLWLAAAGVLYLAVVLSVAMYATSSSDRDLATLADRLPASPAAVLGLLVAAGTGLFVLAALTQRDSPAVGESVSLVLVAAGLVCTGLWVGVARYFDPTHLETWLPRAPVRVMGALLVVAAGILAVATVAFYVWSPVGEYPIPVGVAVMVALGVGLLRVDLVADGTDASEAPAPGDAN